MLELHLLNGSAPGRSRVVNEDVDFLKPGERFLHNGADLVRVSDITSKRERLNSEPPQLLRRLLAALPLPRAKYQVRTHLCQALGHLAPEAHGASRNNSHSSCKVKELLGIHANPATRGSHLRFQLKASSASAPVRVVTPVWAAMTGGTADKTNATARRKITSLVPRRIMFPPPIRCGLAQQHPVEVRAVA